MEFIGKITNILPPRSGVSKTGKDWKVTEFVVTNDDRFPQSFVFELLNKDLENNIGDDVTVKFDGNAREYNGRFYNSLKAWEVTTLHKALPQETKDPFGGQIEDSQTQLPF